MESNHYATMNKGRKCSYLSLVVGFILMFTGYTQGFSAVVSVYPQTSTYWTGSVNSAGTKAVSSVIYTRGGGNERGWMKFDLSLIPSGATINSVTLKYFITNMYNPSLQFRKVTIDPVSGAGSTLWSQIGSGTIYVTAGINSLGWNSRILNTAGKNEIQNSLSQGWAAIGMYCTDGSSLFEAYADGWNQPNKPYLEINYTSNLQNDIALDGITSPINFSCEDTMPINIKMVNAGTNTISSVQIIWTINSGGMPNVSWTGTLNPGGNVTYTLANHIFTPGNYIITVTLANPNGQADPFTANNSKTVLLQITPKPSIYQQPVDKSIGVGGDATFKTVGAGANITYQWQYSTDGGLNFTNVPNLSPYSNVTSSEMNITGASQSMNGYLFRCIVSGTCPPPAITDTVLLSVGPPVTVSAGHKYACVGQTANIPITIKDALNIQGMKLTLLFTTGNITFNSPTYINPMMNGSFTVTPGTGTVTINWVGNTPVNMSHDTICKLNFSYSTNSTIDFDTLIPGNCKVTGSSGATFPSHYTNGSLTNASPVIISHPENKLAITGTTVFFRVVYSGTPTFQWQVSTDNGTNFNNLSNNTTYSGIADDTLYVTDPTLSMNGYRYRCILNACGNDVTSNAATMSVMKLVKTWFDTIYDCTGFTPARQIFVPIRVSNFDSINSVSLSFMFKNTALQYAGTTFTHSALQNITIFASPGGPGKTMVRIASIAPLGFMVIPSNEPLAIIKFNILNDTTILQWETWTQGACQYSTGPDTAIYVFDAWFGNGYVLDGGPTISTNPVDATVYAGQTATFTCSGSTHGSALAYQWQFSPNGSTWTDCTDGVTYQGSTTSSLTVITALSMNGYKFRCILNGLCDQQITSQANLTVNAPPIYVTIPNIIACQGDTIIVPINVQNFSSVCSISLSLGFNNTLLTYAGFKELNPSLPNPANFLVNAPASNVLMAWASTSAGTIAGTSTLVKLKFVANQLITNSPLNWNTGSCTITNCSATTISTTYTGSSISVNPIPEVHNIITPFPAAGHFCAGGTGVPIQVDVTQLGVNYGLYCNGLIVQPNGSFPGTGFGITFGTFNIPGTYTVRANYPATGCSVQMDQVVNVSLDAPPVAYTVTGTGSFCTGGPGLPVGLSDSDVGKDYFLFLDGIPIDTILSADGNPLSFGNQTVAGTYTIMGRNALYETCPTAMTGSAVITINPYPDAAGTITGPSQNPCQGGSGYLYCVPVIPHADSYSWTTPPGCTPVGSTSSNCLTVNFSPTATSGTISVKGSNICGDGASSSLIVTLSPLPVAAGTISGPDTVCPGASVTYTLPAVEHATDYSWTYPAGFTGPATTATPQITLTVGTLAVSGTITCNGHNTCGNGATSSKNIVVRTLAGAAGGINGTTTPCQGATVTYSVAPIANVPSNGYVWQLSSGMTGSSNTNSISVTFSNTVTTGTISVRGHNTCGDGAATTININALLLPVAAGTISGPAHVCKGSTYTYTIPAVDNATSYIWTVPNSGFTGSLTTIQPSATFTIGTTAINGNITVKGNNVCGAGASSSITVTVHDNPAPTLPSLGTVCMDAGSIVLSGGSPAGGTYSGTGVSGGSFNPTVSGAGTFTITYTYTDPFTCTGSVQNTINVVDYPMISGNVTYDNPTVVSLPNTPLDSIKINLKNIANTITFDSTLSSSSAPIGGYSFRCLTPPASYNLVCSSTRPFYLSSINATDALKIARYAVGLDDLTLFRRKAADVNNTNSVNSVDALLVMKRWAGMISSFTSGNWLFNTILTNPVTVNTTDVSRDILALCYGDVNGSAEWTAPPKISPDILVSYESFLTCTEGDIIDIPVRIENQLTAGAISLSLEHPDSDLEILEVISNLDGYIYNAHEGDLRFAWYNINPVKFNKYDVLFHIKARILSKNPVRQEVKLDVGGSSEFSDPNAIKYVDIKLMIPSIRFSDCDNEIVKEYYLGDNRPNPFSHTTEITYGLPEEGDVNLIIMNLLGEKISVLKSSHQPKGNYSVMFDGSGLAPGMYMYRIDIKGKSKHFNDTRMMIITE